MLYEVIPTKIFRSGADSLTYESDLSLRPGHIVIIPLGNKKVVGIVKNVVKFTTFNDKKPNFKLKKVEKLLYTTPLPPHLLKSLLWLGKYYLLPLPSVASLFLPVGVEKSRRAPKSPSSLPSLSSVPLSSINIPLSPAQKSTLTELINIKTPTRLLYGITGSGKTNIYLELARTTLLQGKSVILLVPEIALTSQLVSIFESTFSRQVALIHSKETESSRHQLWESLLNDSNSTPRIVIGPRSALFAPLSNLGLIIIDESHESAYYQDNSPKYSALRLASFMSSTLKIPCITGTATPTVADFYLAKQKSALVSLTEKAKKTAIKPSISIIDLKDRTNFTKNRYFSNQLIDTIKENYKNHHQTLIFHNRRGSSPLTICEKCGYEALCPTCFLPLTLHSDTFSLVCHACGYTTPLPHSCPSCHTPGLIHKGYGTKLLESELNKLFPSAKIARFDADNKKSETVSALYGDLHSGNIDIIIGTQAIARGLDLPHLASVGIVQADSGLNLPDFSAEEKTFQLLTQVIGRVGRGHLDVASVIIQTYQPTHPVLKYACIPDYLSFADYALVSRQKHFFPPYYFLARLTVSMKTEKSVITKIKALSTLLRSSEYASSLLISTPTPVFHERSTTGYSWQIILRAKSRTTLLSAISIIPSNLSVSVTLDPPSLL